MNNEGLSFINILELNDIYPNLNQDLSDFKQTYYETYNCWNNFLEDFFNMLLNKKIFCVDAKDYEI